MDKRTYRYLAGLLITGVIAGTLLLFPGIAVGVTPSVGTDKTTYLLGETVNLPGSIAFAEGEILPISTVTLNISGPQPLNEVLPISPGHYEIPLSDLVVDVSWQNIGFGYGYGNSYKGLGSPAMIDYDIAWTPDALLDPAPVFTLLPNTDTLWDVPTLPPPPTPTPGGPQPLPDATELFSIPQVAVPGPAPGAPAELPTVTEAFTIPQIPEPQPPVGVPTLDSIPNTALAFDLPDTRLPHGLASDGTDFYVVVDGVNPGDPDDILKLDASGTLLATMTAPSDQIEGIAYLSNALWVADNEDLGSGKRIRKLDPTTGAELSSFAPPHDQWAETGGLGVEGSSLWLARRDGCGFSRVSQTGSGLEQVFTPCDPHDFHGVVESDGFLYTVNSGTVRKWNTNGQEQQSWNTTLADLRGSTFLIDVMYLLDAGATEVHKTAIPSGITISTNPLGITYDGTNLWLLIDATPVDKIAKVDSSGTLLDSFDAPGAISGGITYLGAFLWVATSDNDQHKAHKIDPATGNVTTSVSIPGCCGDIGGLSYDGTNLVAVRKANNEVTTFNTLGQQQQTEWIDGASQEGATGLAFDTGSNRAFIAKAGAVMRIDTLIDVQQTWNTTLTDIQGQTYYDAVLYMADVGTNKVYKTSIPSGISVTTNPRGMAYDGTYLWVLVDGTPVDKILKVDATSGALLDSFDASSSQADAIAYLGAQLYVSVNMTDPCCSRSIVVHNATTGAQVTSFFPPGFDDVTGLTSDGTYLYSGPKFGGDVRVFDSSGNQQDQFWMDGNDGVGAQAYDTQENQLYAAKGGTVKRYSNTGGQPLQQWTISGLTTINGATFVNAFLYLADAATDKVYGATIPTAPVSITNTPKGMATDGTSLYILVEASPNDKVLRVSSDGTLLDSFDAPGNNADAIDYLGASLYIGVNDAPQGGCCPDPKIYKVSTSGAVESSFQVPGAFDRITALTNDGINLIVGMEFDGKWIVVDPANPFSAIETFQFGFPFMDGFQSFLYALGNLYGANGNQFNEFNKNNGEILDSSSLQGVLDVTALAYLATTIYIADASNNTVRGSTFAETPPELTIAGSYDAKLVVQTNGQTFESSLASLALQKITNVVVNITEPLEGFSSVTPGITIAGNLNDPSIENVEVGIALPFTTLFGDDVQDPASTSLYNSTGLSLWHIACKFSEGDPFPKADSFPCAWYYGKNNTQNYDTGATNFGDLELIGPNSNGSFSIGADTEFTFSTWWDTEPGTQYDRKQIQVSTDGGSTWQTIAMIVPPFEIDFFTGQPFFIPFELLGQNIQWLLVPQSNFAFDGGFGTCPPFCDPFFGGGEPEAVFDGVFVDLSAFDGQNLHIRFHFDTVDAAVNQLEGWYIDDVEIGGAGFQGVTAPVTPVTDPALLAQSIFGTFSTAFNLAEGINTVSANATNPYDSSLQGTAQITGFLDTTAPDVVLDPIDSPTNTPAATLSGTIDDVNFQELVITQTTILGTKTIITLKSLPEGNTFSKNVSLVEGTNTFEATATDGAGFTGSAMIEVVLDTTGPVLTVLDTNYPIGVISARSRDPVIFNIDAADLGSGVDRVEIVFPGGPGEGSNTGDFIPAGNIPEAVRDLWGATGQWVLPTVVPDQAPPGTFSLTVRAFDNAGNQSTGTVEATVVSSLQAFVFNLMPDWNLVSVPLIPDNTDLTVLAAGIPGIDSIWYYDATLTGLPQEDRWLLYTPEPSDVDTLTTLVTGRGYWFKMDPAAFQLSAPLGPGLPQTPKPIKLSYTGQFLPPGAVPPSYAVVTGWNNIDSLVKSLCRSN